MSGISNEKPEFGRIRGAIWPIHSYELKKFLPMGLMMFFILFNYTILRDTKDSLVITASINGSAVIPFLKIGFVLPASILFVLLYAKLSNIMSREKLFYTLVSSFIIYFGVFAFILYPNRELIHPSPETVSSLQEAYPHFQHIFPLWGTWMYSIFYVMSELWGSVMISLLFWQFANEITRTNEAKRFYGLFGLLANVSLVCSGFTVQYLSDIRESLPPEVDAWGISLNYMMSAVIASGVFIMMTYRWMNLKVLTDPQYYDKAASLVNTKSSRPKLSLVDSFRYIFSSKYLGLIAVLIVGYGISINLIEVIWKGMLKEQYPNPNDYNAFMGAFSVTTGIVTMTLIMMFKGIVRKFGWFTGAIMTPAVLLITGGFFYAFVLFEGHMQPVAAFFGTTTLFMAVILGAIQNVASKATKYSLFDPTKEMSYIPLDQELKVKGKAAVDVIGNSFGKAGGGMISGFILVITAASSVVMIAHFLVFIVIATTLSWMYAVKNLSVLYNKALQSKAPAEVSLVREESNAKEDALMNNAVV
ncbi:Npt1/Npt2 family nucleotide transporter [Legionella shakespearei]|uniref:ADP,ATP carrier protein n=1 Tax=Legionella shakespearei DSM 23087 TaxID=1122169 RepID=A0A0W0YL02_9GAMM|nr:Npt1/Npt2 family nucleotide transporter [Legionella shakespearei]KTD57593.1 ADP,ATP carrier protein 1 [Legionella shakespearei DSM 23087]